MSDVREKLKLALAQKASATSDFDLNSGIELSPSRVLKPSAVLVCVNAATQSVILTKRSMQLKHHPGQVAFPGGKQDTDDVDLVATALREAKEEIGLPPEKVEILGSLAPHETVTSYTVTPIISWLDSKYDVRPEIGEVSEVFEVPLSFLIDAKNFRIETRIWQGQARYYYAAPFGPYYIWGATARILRGLAEQVS